MRLILSGGGSGEKTHEAYKVFARELGGGKVLYVALAWNHGNMQDCILWLKAEIEPFGIFDIEDVISAKQITKKKLAEVKGVFIGGGNTFSLLKQLKSCKAFDNLKEYIKNDGLVMGGSAGAMIFGRSIDSCKKTALDIHATDENIVGLKDTNGFDAINGYSLFVHYNKRPEQTLKTKENISNLINDGHKLICLPEETSLFICGDKKYILGTKDAELFNGKIKKTLKANGEKQEITI